MSQSYGIPGDTRDSKDDLIRLFNLMVVHDCPYCDDDVQTVCRHEVPSIRAALDQHGRHVEKQVDALHVVTRVLKIGETKHTRAEMDDYCRLHNEPLPWPDTETRQTRGNGSDDTAA